MRNLWGLVFVVGVAGAAHARGREPQKLLGWSEDGLSIAYTEPGDFGPLGDFGSEGIKTVGVVLDARTGRIAKEFLLKKQGDATKEDKAWMKTAGTKADFDAWQAANHPACTGDKLSPDGKSSVEVTTRSHGIKVTFKKGRWTFDSPEDKEDEKKGTFDLTITRDGKSTVVASWSSSSPMAGAGAGFTGEFSVCWPARGRRLGWVVRRHSGMMRDEGEFEVRIAPIDGTRIQLVADASVLSEAAAAVAEALDKAGFTPTSSKASNEKSARPASVVYAATGFEEAARKLALAVPGGATVAKLDWKAPFDLIVGIGATAVTPRK